MRWPTGALLAALALPAGPARAAPAQLTLGEALELALANNHRLQAARLDLETTRSQVSQAYAPVMPRVDASASYTRNVKAPDPFAGSAAGGVFGGFDSIGWLAFNESARTDGDPATNPIGFGEFAQRQAAGLDAAGIDPATGNPFLVENQFVLGLSVTQTLYDGAAFAGLRAAEAVDAQQQAALDAEVHALVDQVTRAYYGALLGEAQVAVLAKRVARVEANLAEVSKRVAQGVVPQFQQLSAEVELANVQTSQLQAAEAAAAALDGLRQACVLPPDQPLVLADPLTVGEIDPAPSVGEAIAKAREVRPDLRRLRALDRAYEAKVDAAGSAYWPTVSAFLNMQVQGSVPDDRTTAFNPDPADPFTYSTDEKGFFADEYWFPVVNLGLRLSWNLFSGFTTDRQVEQARIERRKTRTSTDELEAAIAIEVTQAARAMETAAHRLDTQSRNIARAELNYQHAEARVANGVSTQTDLRAASDQLDESRFNQLQAAHDYLIAKTRYAIAIGQPPTATDRTGGE